MSGEEIATTAKQCFSSIQSRKLLGGLESCHLCPSMDLIVYTAGSTQNLYRTMSWQKVATLVHEEDLATTTSCCCWSPSGKWIAVANDKLVQLYGVEPLANPGFSNTESPSTEAQHSWTVENGSVKGLVWAHVGRAHPTAWRSLERELENEISWSYQSQYVDTTNFFLPPSGYWKPAMDDEDHHHHPGSEEHTMTTALPESKTPLSVLCLWTDQHLEIYLHGRYRLLTLQRKQPALASAEEQESMVIVSNDLSYILMQAGPAQWSLYHLPFLKRDRYPLQIVASLHASISSHLTTLGETITECFNSWKSSLKPLDAKLQPLLKLLQNYGVDDQPLGVILKQYILVGHTSESSSVANAMDQFFTSVQMNDQLLQRMERSLHGALANAESQARKGLLSPMQALCLQVQELAGHVQFHGGATSDSSSLQTLVQASQQLWISVHTLLLSMVQGRHLVRDFCSWLRSAGSQIKARGTAANAPQRENAKKRRVPQALLERLLASLNTAPQDNATTVGLAEHLLNITTSTLLKDTTTLVPLRGEKLPVRPESPSSVLGVVTSTPTVPRAVHLTTSAFEEVLVNPLANIPESIVPTDFYLSLDSASCKHAMHMRIGRDVPVSRDPWEEEEEAADEKERTYFAPKAILSSQDNNWTDAAGMAYCRQWAIVATASDDTVQLFALPLGWRDPNQPDMEDDEENAEHTFPFYLTSKMVLPPGGAILDIGFYGDDGKSSLSSGNDSGTGKERRQKLGILYKQQDSRLELWLASYDSIQWQTFPFTPNLGDKSDISASAIWCLRPKTDQLGDDACQDDEERVQYAHTRSICSLENRDVKVQLRLCGSRGVGAVTVGGEGVTTVELLDLEEDEEAVDDDEEFDEDKDEA